MSGSAQLPAFAAWETPFQNDAGEIVSVSFKNARLDSYSGYKPYLAAAGHHDPEANSLEAVFMSFDSDALYRIIFKGVFGYRMLDENALLELWDPSLPKRPAKTTVRVAGHGWTQESPVLFALADDAGSFLLVTDELCLEVVCRDAPDILRLDA